jgi:hypothetical protein
MRKLGSSLMIFAVAGLIGRGADGARPPKAEKAGARPVLVLRLEGGGLPDDLVQKLDAASREQVKATMKGARLLPAPALEFEAMRMAAGCSDDSSACLASLGATLSAHDVVRIQVSGNVPKKARVNVTVVRVRDQRQKQQRFDIDDLDPSAIEDFRYQLALALGDKRVSPPTGAVALVVPGEIGGLEGVEIMIDDRKQPLAALKSLPAGGHRLEIYKEGFDRFIATPVVKPGRETTVQVAFEKQKPIEVAAPDASPGRTPEAKDAPPPERVAEVSPEARSDLAPQKDLAPASGVEAPIDAPKEPPRLSTTWWLAGGTLAGFAVGTVSGILLLNAKSHAEEIGESCNGHPFDVPVCRKGNLSYIGEWVGFGSATVLGLLTIYSFIEEGGFSALKGSGESQREAVSAGLSLGRGGFEASLRAPF